MGTKVWPANPVDGSPQYSAIDDRRMHSVLLGGATAARPLGARSGVRPGTPSTTVAVSGGYWTVRPHAGCMDIAGAANGAYQYATDAETAPVLIPSAHASWARVDAVYARLDDPGNGDGTTTPQLVYGYEPGTPASSNPLPPTVWTGVSRSMLLAYVDVPAASAGGTSAASVRWVAPYSFAAGAIISVRNQAERDLITWGTAENPATVWRADLFRHERNAGGGWRTMTPAGAIFAGTTDSNGIVLIPHGLGYAPSKISVAIAGTALGSGSDTISILATPVVWSVDATYLGVRIARRDTSTWYTATAVAVTWTAA